MEHRPPARDRIGKAQADIRERRFRDDERRDEQRDLDRNEAARRRQQVTDQQAQVARAERLRGGGVVQATFGADDGADAAGDERRADDGEDAGEQGEHLRGAEHQRQDRAQRQRDVDGRQHHHEIGRAHQQIVERAPREAGNAAEQSADEHGAERRRHREAERRAGAEEEPGKDVATVAVGPEQEQRRRVLVRRPDQAATGEPGERHPRGSVLLISLLELVHELPAVDERRVPRLVRAGNAHHRRRRVEQAGEMRVHRVRRGDRRGNRCQQRDGDQRQAHAARHARSALVSLARGSTSASARSDTRVPQARNSAPAPAQPATRKMSRARSACSIRLPRPGHAVITSTTNDPLSSVPMTRP